MAEILRLGGMALIGGDERPARMDGERVIEAVFQGLRAPRCLLRRRLLTLLAENAIEDDRVSTMTAAMNQHAPIPSRPATYQDVLDAPPNMVAEIINGALHTHPRPAMPHVLAGSRLGGRIDRYFGDDDDGGPGGWWILDEPELHLGADVIVPDLAGWRRERMPNYPDSAYCSLAPDWACEILSPSTRKLDRYEKRAIYAREGVGHLWFVDPTAKGLEAFELRNGEWVLIAALQDDAEVRVAPFDACSFSLSVLWP